MELKGKNTLLFVGNGFHYRNKHHPLLLKFKPKTRMMEQKTIAYTKGITRSPSDMLCQDGELAECVNLEVRGEELVPIEIPKLLPFSLNSGEKLLLVHKTISGEKNYIIYYNNSYLKAFYVEEGKKTAFDLNQNISDITSIRYVGNTIVVYTKDSPHYFLYSEKKYKYLGSKLPEIGISFDLSGDFLVSEEFDLQLPKLELTDDEYQRDVSAQLLAEVNKFVESKSVSSGKFMFPFFVRYAIRLFDGTHTHQSAPILMLPSTQISPFAASYTDARNLQGRSYKTQIGAFVSRLEATISSLETNYSNWKDIISGIDIFVSKQIYTYDQNGTRFGNAAFSGSVFLGKYKGTSTAWDGYSKMVDNITLRKEEGQLLYRWNIPSKNIEDINSEITGTSLFYRFASLNTSDIKENANFAIDGNLAAIETQETLDDDYMTHDVLVPKSTFVYNKRLNISNIKRILFSGFPLDSMIQTVKNETKDGVGYNLTFGYYKVYTFIKASGNNIVVESGTSSYGALYGSYLFYPDTDAYKMVIVDSSKNIYAEVKLTEHPLLNGAYAFLGFNSLQFYSGIPDIPETEKSERLPNKLFTSEVNNVFLFPLEGINTVGTDEIIGMSAVTVPISQGQFGQYPLLVFCSDGNFALKVDEQGYYSGISPIQEDTVLGNDKITSLENSIAVITKKGIMMTSGGEMAQLAGNMEGAHFNSLELNVSDTGEFASLISDAEDNDSFLSYLYGAQMSYDYSSNRLVIHNPSKSYSYVYSFENGTVTKLSLSGENVIASVMDYPDTIIQTSSGKLYSLYEKEDLNTNNVRQYGIAITRPLKLDNAVSYKIVHQIKNLGRLSNESYVKYRLYGSMDGINYHIVRSLRSRSYLYYRMVFYTYMLPKEGFSGTLIAFDYRMSHKFR